MIVIDNVDKFNELVSNGLDIIDVTNLDPKPSTGWTYDGNTFVAPEYQWAKVKNNSVIEILTLNNDAAQSHMVDGDTELINLEFIDQKPEVGWSYVDGVFSAP